MYWIIIIIGIFVVIGLFSNANQNEEAINLAREKQAKDEYKERKQKRIAAYADYLRRTSTDEKTSMSDNELFDLIDRAIDGFKIELEKAVQGPNIAIFICAVIAVFTIFNGDEEGIRISMIGAAIGIGYRSARKKKVITKYVNNGWDIERLKV